MESRVRLWREQQAPVVLIAKENQYKKITTRPPGTWLEMKLRPSAGLSHDNISAIFTNYTLRQMFT